jgi:nicotinamidase/pyrazinamidase
MRTLIIIDPQNDFTNKAGSLYVDGAEKAIENINKLLEKGNYDKVIATQDWHPRNHVSFASQYPGKKPFVDTVDTFYGKQELWPDHCIQGTWGADIDSNLDAIKIDIIWRKGTNIDIDSYSAVQENDKRTKTGLHNYLGNVYSKDGSLPLFAVVGFATDVCVFNSARDIYTFAGGQVSVIQDCCAGVNHENTSVALQKLYDLGVNII